VQLNKIPIIKHQAPNKFQIPNSNNRNAFVWNLVIGAWLLFGIWLFVIRISVVNAGEISSSRFFYSGDGKISLRSNKSNAVFSGTYRNPDGTYRNDAIKKINTVFGASASPLPGKEEIISLRLIEFLDYLQDNFNGGTITIASGYRSPSYNTHLRENGALAGKASLHQYGMAADIQMTGVSSKKIWEYVRELKFGGTGFYHGKYVHLDAGPSRWWDETSSKVGTDIADDNKLIMLVADRDIYKPGETINLMFARMTAWPIGVEPEFVLERIDNKNSKKIIPSPLVGEGKGEGCHIFNDWQPMLNIPWQIPSDLKAGTYTIRAKFCEKQWEAMPSEIATSEFKILGY
jgi:uncharacterized protein YcbK (DUF882 family)